MTDRLWLSPPHMSNLERERLLAAFDSNWIAPIGPDLAEFEESLAQWTDRPAAAALSSGTAALHLALQLMGVGRGDDVLVSSFTFVASANPIGYLGARPVFVDSERATWNMDPELVAEELARRADSGDLPAAVMAVDLYGQCADYRRLEPLCAEYAVPLIADATEALGAKAFGRPAGSFGDMAALSFNGNKIITTGGGGALCGAPDQVARARHLATQAREAAAHYEHLDAGYNYRLSNLLAAVGCGQLNRLPTMMGRRREINATYHRRLGGLAGLTFAPVPEWSEPNCWLTVCAIDPGRAGTDRETVRLALDAAGIEARPAWKPMHLQPLFADAPRIAGAVSEEVFDHGLCLPSGSAMTDADIDRVVDVVAGCWPA
jgi:dTDP-4-amino-4,6-dideoxygalactose transaminase